MSKNLTAHSKRQTTVKVVKRKVNKRLDHQFIIHVHEGQSVIAFRPDLPMGQDRWFLPAGDYFANLTANPKNYKLHAYHLVDHQFSGDVYINQKFVASLDSSVCSVEASRKNGRLRE